MSKKLLYIGLNGFAGSGKDTVAKLLSVMLNNNWNSYEEFHEYYNNYCLNNTRKLATFNLSQEKDERKCICIAFADQLKYICSSIFGIPVDRFYYNKANAWICINKDFQYTEVRPNDDQIVSAEDFFIAMNNYKNSEVRYYMSLREILVYIGTYLCQNYINKNIFINIINNQVKQKVTKNDDIKYVIVTDVRFLHELDFIRNKNGITISITRDDVKQLDNVAEHDLDDEEDYDFIIDNNGTYEDLFKQVWDMVHDNIEFSNITETLMSRDGTDNYIRLVDESDSELVYKLCPQYHIQSVSHSGTDIVKIDPSGGPCIFTNSYIEGSNIYVNKIEFIEDKGYFIHTLKR